MTSNSGSSVMRLREASVMPQSLSGEVGHWRGDAHLLPPKQSGFRVQLVSENSQIKRHKSGTSGLTHRKANDCKHSNTFTR